jgi:hypothetical protein
MNIADYHTIIERKRNYFEPRGLSKIGNIADSLFEHQKHCVEFSLRAGCSAMFLDTGLGKTRAALEWGQHIVRHTNKPVLMLAPLGVVKQHSKEADDFGVETIISRDGTPPTKAIVTLTNYDRLQKFDVSDYGGIILDESSILKSMNGATSKKLIAAFNQMKYRLACTATPAPNDHAELGMHSEFLGVLSQSQMLVRWFLHDSADTGTWKMKGHAVKDFWSWVASWSRCVSKPSDLGFSDFGFQMPELIETRHIIAADRSVNTGADRDGQNFLFRIPDTSATSIHAEKRLTKNQRAEKVGELVSLDPLDAWLIWADTDYDADAVAEAVPSAVEIRGSMSIDMKEERLDAFSKGQIKHLLTKPSIAGYGLNFQHCRNMAFAGINFSYENYYQAIRRCWRFGQKHPVNAHIVCADTEASIWDVVSRKSHDHALMKSEMADAMARAIQSAEILKTYQPEIKAKLPSWMV